MVVAAAGRAVRDLRVRVQRLSHVDSQRLRTLPAAQRLRGIGHRERRVLTLPEPPSFRLALTKLAMSEGANANTLCWLQIETRLYCTGVQIIVLNTGFDLRRNRGD